MSLDLPFDNSYARLPDQFYTRLDPTPVETPRLLALNDRLARSLGLDASGLKSPEGVAALAGNLVPGGAEPLAQVYGGHQFGHWAGRLGDGRAILLGEVVTGDGHRFDIQLKGSGPTPYSRMGDGRAWLGPVLREYVVSEAMAALGIPTTRALAAVATGETVVRERAYPGAVLTRVAASHLRVGTFQFFAATGDRDALEALTDYAIERHYPGAEGALGLLEGVVARQATLVADWMAVGFVHGVMNTDNTTISGETIDYGPCAFIDAYHPMRVFSSIDSAGRYAYARQPDVMMWNLAQFAGALLPLIGETETAQRAIDRFPEIFQKAWLGRFGAKLGIEGPEKADADLIHGLLDLMAAGGSDFTNTFRALGTAEARDEFADRDAFADWEARWRARLARDGTTPEDRIPAMSRVNPAVIPRTHRIEQAIQKALAGNLGLFERLNAALARPYELPDDFADLALPPSEEEIVPRTFCGT